MKSNLAANINQTSNHDADEFCGDVSYMTTGALTALRMASMMSLAFTFTRGGIGLQHRRSSFTLLGTGVSGRRQGVNG